MQYITVVTNGDVFYVTVILFLQKFCFSPILFCNTGI